MIQLPKYTMKRGIYLLNKCFEQRLSYTDQDYKFIYFPCIISFVYHFICISFLNVYICVLLGIPGFPPGMPYGFVRIFFFFFFLFFRRQGFRMITFDRQAGPLQNFNRSHIMVIGRSVLFSDPARPPGGGVGRPKHPKIPPPPPEK